MAIRRPERSAREPLLCWGLALLVCASLLVLLLVVGGGRARLSQRSASQIAGQASALFSRVSQALGDGGDGEDGGLAAAAVDEPPPAADGATQRPVASGVPPPRQVKQAGSATKAVKARCQGTLGTWCADYWTQAEVPAVTAPRGTKNCSLDCNQGVGTCSALSGLCTCPAGWTGFNCLLPLKRYCTSKYRLHGFDQGRQPPSWTPPGQEDDMDISPRSHCVGFCDEDLGVCYCPSNTTYGRIPAALEAWQGSPPERRGRPMNWWCQPKGAKSGTVTPEQLFGDTGWCMAAEPEIECECVVDGWGGRTCETPVEQYCFNQCNGRGECLNGFCRCHEGWHGIDCAHRSATADDSKPGLEAERPWLADLIHTPAAQDFPAGATRKRPLIFVYDDLPADYTTLIQQYSLGGGSRESCKARFFDDTNATQLARSFMWPYNLEAGFLEWLLQSEHRTLNPEEADFFYVPIFPSCWVFPVRDMSDSLRDTWYFMGHNRAQGATNMLLEAYHWLSSHHPWWDRRGGKDHIWLVTHDEASCFVPSAIRPSIILSHWGRTELNIDPSGPRKDGVWSEHGIGRGSDTAYGGDDYSFEMNHTQFEPKGFLRKLGSHPCFDPVKDLVVPLMKDPDHWHLSPLAGAPTRNRTLLAFHRGRIMEQSTRYSRGVRQRLAKAAAEGGWREKYGIAMGASNEPALSGDYSALLASSTFCLVLQGDGWSARMDDAVLHGCIPVVLIDGAYVSFETVIDFSRIGLRVNSSDLERLPEILLAVSPERRQEMQRNLAKVWQKYAYTSYRPYARRLREIQAAHQHERDANGTAPPASLPPTVPALEPDADDAFSVIMAWLYTRIPATR